jgi:hypothetical protein
MACKNYRSNSPIESVDGILHYGFRREFIHFQLRRFHAKHTIERERVPDKERETVSTIVELLTQPPHTLCPLTCSSPQYLPLYRLQRCVQKRGSLRGGPQNTRELPMPLTRMACPTRPRGHFAAETDSTPSRNRFLSRNERELVEVGARVPKLQTLNRSGQAQAAYHPPPPPIIPTLATNTKKLL